MPADLFGTFQESLRREQLWRPGESVLIAVSGGADSLCLLDLFARLHEETTFPLWIAHLNHSLRGEESDRDAQFVSDLAARMDLPFYSRRLSPGTLEGTGEGVEAAARRARRAFLEETAQRLGAKHIALGHTRDDQAESLLIRLIRGSGRLGLAGIYPHVDGRFIRPLLECSRKSVEDYLRERGLGWRVDSTNADLRRTRNRIRHRLLPFLATEFNPEITAVLARTAGILREEEEFLDGMTRDLVRRLLRREKGMICMAIPALRALPTAMRRRLLRLAGQESNESGSAAPLDFALVERMEKLVEEARHGSAVTLSPQLEARVLYSDLLLVPAKSLPILDGEIPLPVPGAATLPGLCVRVVARHETAAGAGDPRQQTGVDRALLDADVLPGPLRVRVRRRGDAFRPLGAPGASKLRAYLINQKVPRPLRERIPLVVAGDRIAWVVGYQIDDRFKVTSRTRRVLVLSKETA